MISILMPVYNGIEFINESVISVINQTFKNWELIIGVNGHPKDSDIYNIAQKYENIDPRIKVYDLFNIKGKSNSLNYMIKYCNYKYVALLDVDDIWHIKKLEIQSKFMHKYDVIGTKCIWFGDVENVIPKIPLYNFSNFDFSKVNPIINSSSITRKELCFWKNNFDGVEDYDLWIRLRKLNKKFYNCPELLVKHRIHKKSAFNSKKNGDKVKPLLESHGFKQYEDNELIKFNNIQKINMNINNGNFLISNNHNKNFKLNLY
jgi:glycosyltransferase involved in cell wall biosynthesis